MAPIENLLSAEEYARLPNDGEPTELVRGRVVTTNVTNFRHGLLCMRIAKLLANYVDPRRLGYVLCNNAGMITRRNPDTVRGPDVSFFSYSRIAKGALPDGYAEVPPNIVFEVRSPDEHSSKVLDRVIEFHDFGVDVVYVVAPKRPWVTVYFAESFDSTPTYCGDRELLPRRVERAAHSGAPVVFVIKRICN